MHSATAPENGLNLLSNFLDLNALRDYVDYYMLLSQLHLEENEFDEAINDLCRARDLQLKIVSAMSSANRDNNGGAGETLSQTNDVKEERKIAAGLVKFCGWRREMGWLVLAF